MTDPGPYERNALGALLLVGDATVLVERLRGEVGLRSDHFYYGRHRVIFTAMVALVGREPIDQLTVVAEIERAGTWDRGAAGLGPEMYVASLASSVVSAGNVVSYARRVVELANLRAKRLAAQRIVEATEGEDYRALIEAERRLVAVPLPESVAAEPVRRLGVVAPVERATG